MSNKIIHQVYISDNESYPTSENVLKKINQLKEVYSDYAHHVYTNDEIEDILLKNFDESVLTAYKSFRPYCYRSDLARYCLLYIYGGFYFDIPIAPEIKLEFTHPVVLTKGISDRERTGDKGIVETSFVYAEKGHPFLKLMIDLIVNNALYKSYGIHPLDIASPMVAYKAYMKYDNKDEILLLDCNFYPNGNRYASYNGVTYFNFKETQHQANLLTLGCKGTNNYERMWVEKDVFNYTKIPTNKKILAYTDVGDDSDKFLEWCLKENKLYDRAINYYGDSDERFNFIKSLNPEYLFRNIKYIKDHALFHYNLFKQYPNTIVVEDDINTPIMLIKNGEIRR